MVKTSQMKKNLIKIIMLLLACNGLINVVYPQAYINTEIRSKYFGYINFKETQITLPDNILKLSLKEIDTEKTCIQGMFFDSKQKIKIFSDSLWWGELFFPTEIEWFGKQEIPEDFVNLLCDNGMVSIAWDYRSDYMSPKFLKNEATIIHDFKEWNKFLFLGKIAINPNFDSYLILTKETDTSGFVHLRSLFLLNVKDNKITSLVQIAYTQIFEGAGFYFFTKASSREKYCYYGIYRGDYEHKLEKYTHYSFDKNGYVQLHELKGRKKFIIHKYKYKLLKHENIR